MGSDRTTGQKGSANLCCKEQANSEPSSTRSLTIQTTNASKPSDVISVGTRRVLEHGAWLPLVFRETSYACS